MTPEREKEIREWSQQQAYRECYDSQWKSIVELLAEINRLRDENEKLREEIYNLRDELRKS